MIPKRLHFTWKTTALPRPMQAYYDAWRRLHPGWDVRLWTDDSMRAFVAEAYPDFLPVYDSYPKMIQRADAFRYLVLGRLGGIYADLDVEPLQPVDDLLQYAAFLGIEPLEHIFPDRHHQGVPFLLTNAFMGSVPEHRLWRDIVALLPELVRQETFYSTGPSMVTAAVLRMDREDRPTLLAPETWSPLRSNGLRTHRNDEAIALLEPVGTIAEERATLVSHKWMTTWVPWHKRANRFAGVLQLPTQAKWALRQARHRRLAQTTIPDPRQLYTDQNFKASRLHPTIEVAVLLGGRALRPGLAEALAGLDYPREKMRVVFCGAPEGRAAVDGAGYASVEFRDAPSSWNEMANLVLASMNGGSGHLLLVDGSVRAIPRDALQTMLGAGRPVVAANVLDASGEPADDRLFRYYHGAPFKVLYEDGGRDGRARRDPQFRTTLEAQKAFRVLPVDGVGQSFVLIARPVVKAGVRFSDAPYKLHVGAEAFAIMARDKGFEACGLPDLRVIVER